MAEELDLVLESRLRDALHREAEALPFTLSAEAVQRAAIERRRAARSHMVSMFAAAAVVIAAVVGAVALSGPRTNTNVATPSTLQSPAASQLAPSQTAPAPASPSAAGRLPGSAALLGAAGQGAVLLDSQAGDAAQHDQIVAFGSAAHRGSLEIVVACTGGDSVAVAISASEIPASDPGGSDSPFSSRADCDGAPHLSARWDGWNSLILNSGANAAISVPAGIAYRAILVDTSAMAADGEQDPVIDGLPTLAHLSAARSDVGTIIATQRLAVSTGGGAEATAADIRVSSAIRAVIACKGGTLDVAATGVHQTADGVTTTDGAVMGTVSCDGTMQAFDWSRADGPGDAASVVVNASAGTSWGIVVWDMSANAHPNPAVPCGSTSARKTAPGATLYQAGRAVGPAGKYWTSRWGGVVDDGVPVVPATALDVVAGVPLELRIDGDACAGNWTVLYGTPGADGMGVDPVGALAIVGEAATTVPNRENRIALASLPAGDWVVQVSLNLDRGYGTSLVRVHAIDGFSFDVQNRSSVGVIVSVAGDAGATMPGFEPGQSGTVTVPLANAANGIHVEIQGGGCTVLATADYAMAAPFTLIVGDGAEAGSVKLSTLGSLSSTPIPLPSNGLIGCGG